MEKKKSNIKYLLKTGITTFAIATGVFVGTSAIIGNLTLKDYPSDKEIVSVAQDLETDTGYISKQYNKFSKMQHNVDEPIYVCMDKDLSKDERYYAEQSLKYLFNIVGKINPKYYYKIIDKNEFNLKLFKTKIYFGVTEKSKKHSGSIGYIDSFANPFSMYTNKSTLYDFKITRNRAVSCDANELEYMYRHELFHAFGINDVYLNGNNKYYGNTMINGNIGRKISILTPNDLKCLISLYGERISSENREDIFKNYQKEISEYEEYYYDYLSKKVKQDLEITEDTTDCFAWHGQGSYTLKNDETLYVFRYEIRIAKGKYTFQILNENKEELDFCSGDTEFQNGVLILKDVKLKECLSPGFKGNPKGFIQDFVIVKEDGLNFLVNLYNYNKYIGFTSKIYNENDLLK